MGTTFQNGMLYHYPGPFGMLYTDLATLTQGYPASCCPFDNAIHYWAGDSRNFQR